MKTLEFTTDRIYDGAQRVTVTVENTSAPDNFDLVDVTATFTDHSRHISGRVFLPMLRANFTDHQLQTELMRAYDATQYEGI